jgi:hypothetical protein
MSQLAVMPRSDFDVIKEQAQILLESGFLPKAIDTVPKAVAIAMHGAELGIPIWTALNNINVIQGKPSASPQLMLALINRSGQLEDMSIDVNDDRAIVTMKRKGRTAHIEEFSMADARQMMTTEYVNGQRKQIPLADKYNWKQMPQTMMKWRAVAACARVAFPDCILGLYTPEEMGADVSVDDEGNMTVIEVKRETPPQPQLVDKNVDTVTSEVVTQPPAPQPAPETVVPAVGSDELSEEKSQNDGATREVGSDAAFNQIPRTAAEMEQPALGLVEPPEGTQSKRKWVAGMVKEYAILEKGYCKVSAHFDNLIADLYKNQRISDATTTEGVKAEIDLYYADGHHLTDKKPKERKLA